MGKQGTLLLLGTLLGTLLCVPCAAQPPDRSDRLLLSAAAPNRQAGLNDRPNVLFIVADDLNVALGSYLASAPSPQYAGAKTPNLDRLAAEGVRFDRAYVQNPLCNPSRTSFLSGLRPPTTDIYNGQTPPRSKIGDDLRMLPEHFHDHGYFTARVGKIAHNIFEHVVTWDVSKFALSREPEMRFHLPGYLPGVDLSAERDNTWTDGSENGMSRADVVRAVGRPAGLPLSWRATRESPRMTPDGTTATRIVQLMAENRDKPFFIAAGFHKPHQPWVGPVEFFEQHPVDEIQLPPTPPDDTADLPAAAFRLIARRHRPHREAAQAGHRRVPRDGHDDRLLRRPTAGGAGGARSGRLHHRRVHQRPRLPVERARRAVAQDLSVRGIDARAAHRPAPGRPASR